MFDQEQNVLSNASIFMQPGIEKIVQNEVNDIFKKKDQCEAVLATVEESIRAKIVEQKMFPLMGNTAKVDQKQIKSTVAGMRNAFKIASAGDHATANEYDQSIWNMSVGKGTTFGALITFLADEKTGEAIVESENAIEMLGAFWMQLRFVVSSTQ